MGQSKKAELSRYQELQLRLWDAIEKGDDGRISDLIDLRADPDSARATG